jgi:hypothetical protein
MGNTSSKSDIKPVQPSDDGLSEMDFPINRKLPLKGPFFIEGKKKSDGTYMFNIYRLDKSGTYTIVFSFETKIPLSNDYEILYDGSVSNLYLKQIHQTMKFYIQLNTRSYFPRRLKINRICGIH